MPKVPPTIQPSLIEGFVNGLGTRHQPQPRPDPRTIVLALFALARMRVGGSLFTLRRDVFAAIMLVLRPAESAVRRLIVIAAHGLSKSSASSARQSGPAIGLISPLAGEKSAKREEGGRRSAKLSSSSTRSNRFDPESIWDVRTSLGKPPRPSRLTVPLHLHHRNPARRHPHRPAPQRPHPRPRQSPGPSPPPRPLAIQARCSAQSQPPDPHVPHAPRPAARLAASAKSTKSTMCCENATAWQTIC